MYSKILSEKLSSVTGHNPERSFLKISFRIFKKDWATCTWIVLKKLVEYFEKRKETSSERNFHDA